MGMMKMSNEKFTQGEWSVWGDWKIECNGNQIATFETADQKPWEGLANAALMVAAPKMYDEIKHDIEILKLSMNNSLFDESAYDVFISEISRKENLLAKARGE
jgi:hypothetical protein